MDVTLVDHNPFHTSCILSNMVLINTLAFSELEIPYSHLEDNYGVSVVQDSAEEIDATGNRVRLTNAGWQSYDRLVIATGIGFEQINGLDSEVNPHAWIAGPQTTLLASQVASMQQNSTFVMSSPKAPDRCPPGPYERACLVADQLVRNGYTSGNTPRVVVLDANPGIQAEANTFTRAFNDLYGNIIQYVPNAGVQSVDSTGGNVYTDAGQFHGDVLNIIPNNQATKFVRDSGLTDGGRWAPVDPTTYESTVSGFAGIHIIGDSQGSSAPKSGHMANAEAKVCADAIIRILSGLPTDSDERLANITTNSACYSPITRDQASWLTGMGQQPVYR
ncbi:MAG: FAD/NAD(P)-binding oxidoreductase [Gammaproteobacteria bacterium]